jgi:cardiolipin synthase A/B
MLTQTPDIRETVFSDGSQYFAALLQDIDHSSVSIDLETYIFELDSLGQNVANHLADAGLRGVSVRLLLDGAGSSFWNNEVVQQFGDAGTQVRIFHPLPWNISHWKIAVPHLPWLVKLQSLLGSLNRRNHRKICLIDHHLTWIGSFNISKCHLPQAQGGEGWRDTAVRLEGLNMESLQHAFDRAWFNDWSPISRKIFSPANFRLNHIRRKKLRRDLLNRISQCRSRIWITNAYFVPDIAFLRHLKKAARSGVDIRILLPGTSDVFFMPWAAATFYQSLLNSGVRIFEYRKNVLHAKVMILDDWVTVGSSNLDYRSFFHNLEVEAVLSLLSSKNAIQEQFLNDLNDSQEVFLQDLPNRPWWKQAIGRLILYLKRWL